MLLTEMRARPTWIFEVWGFRAATSSATGEHTGSSFSDVNFDPFTDDGGLHFIRRFKRCLMACCTWALFCINTPTLDFFCKTFTLVGILSPDCVACGFQLDVDAKKHFSNFTQSHFEYLNLFPPADVVRLQPKDTSSYLKFKCTFEQRRSRSCSRNKKCSFFFSMEADLHQNHLRFSCKFESELNILLYK